MARLLPRTASSPGVVFGPESDGEPGVAGLDARDPARDVAEGKAILAAGGVSREIVVYSGASDSFICGTCDEHVDTCGEPWRNVQALIAVNSKPSLHFAE